MGSQKITIEVHDKDKPKKKQSKSIATKNKRKEHFKKCCSLFIVELKLCASHFYNAFISLFKVLFYGLAILGDLLIMWGKQNKKQGSKEKPKQKSILDQGW